jgi:V/A-type H+-transporting ATPase subunit E
MSVEELRKAVLEKARKEAEAIISRAEEEARRIVAEAMQKKQALIEDYKARIVSELNPEIRLAEARYRARIIVAEAKGSIIKEISSAVTMMLNGMSNEKRLESLKKLIDEALQEVLNSVGRVEDVVVKISQRDMEFAELIKNYVEERYGIRVAKIERAEVIGGVIIECFDGSIAVDNSYDERLKKALRNVLPQFLR